MLDFSIRLFSIMGAVWVSLAVFYTNGEELALRYWWQFSRATGIESWSPFASLSGENLAAVSASPLTGAALGSLSIVCFLAAIQTLRKPPSRRRRWPGAA